MAQKAKAFIRDSLDKDKRMYFDFGKEDKSLDDGYEISDRYLDKNNMVVGIEKCEALRWPNSENALNYIIRRELTVRSRSAEGKARPPGATCF